MKFKKLIGATTLLLAASTATAASFTLGDWDGMKWSNSVSGTFNQTLPFDKDVQYTGCQSVITQDEISQLAPVTNASGVTTVNSITEVCFAICPISNSGGLVGTAEFKVYLTPTDHVEFEKVDGSYYWFDYSAEGTVSGSVIINAEDELAFVTDEPFIITVPLSDPFEVTAQNFILTILMDNQIEDEYYCWDVGTFSYNPDMTVRRVRSGKSEGKTSLSGKFTSSDNTSSQIPILNFTYTTEEREAVGGGETYGDPTDHYVGPWDNPGEEAESNPTCIPPGNIMYKYGFAQAIYSADQLNQLQKADGNGVTTADINSLTFKYSFDDPTSVNGSMSWTVYVENTDLEELPKVDNKYQWLPYSKEVKGSGDVEFEFGDFYEDELECTSTFDTPLRYEGKGLLVTWVTEGCLDEYGMTGCYGLVFDGENGQAAAAATDSRKLEDLTGNISTYEAASVKSVLPVLKLGITPVTVTSAVKPVTFESVEASIRKVTVDPSVKFGYNTYKGANLITLDFKLKDEANAGPYEIKLGNNVLGTIAGTEGVIAGVPYDKDAFITVTPLGEGAIGSSTTVNKSAFDDFFPAPTLVEAQEGSTALYTEYDAYTKYDYNRATVEGIATFRLNSTIPFVTIGGTYDGQTMRVVYPTSPSLPEAFESFRPVNDATDYEANDGRISFYNSKMAEQYVTHGKIEAPTSSLRISAKLFVKAPVLVADVPAVAATFTADNDTYDIASAAGRSIREIQKDYDNGSSYASSTATATLAWDELIENVTYPDALVYKSGADYIDIFAPEGHQIHWCFVADPAEEEEVEPEAAAMRTSLPEGAEWTAAEGGNIHTHYFDTLTSGNLHLKTTDAEGNDTEQDLVVTIKKDGTVLGIDAVGADFLGEGEIYFDLQGRRVANPAAGGLYIRLRSGKASKVAL